MTTPSDLRRALEAVPAALLDPDDQRVLDDALTSLEVLAGIDIVPTAITFVGSSGSGTSTMVNAALGTSVAPVGVLRPTTDRITMYGRSGPVAPASPSEYVHVPDAPSGVVVIDTPPWEHDPDAVRSALAVADHVVLVVTPMRYADASVADLVTEIPVASTTILNRLDADVDDLGTLRDSVERSFGPSVVEVPEGTDASAPMRLLIDGLPTDEEARARAAIVRSAAVAAARHVARAAAAMSGQLAGLVSSIEEVDPSVPPTRGYTVLEEWAPTRAELIRLVDSGRRAVDRAVRRAGNEELTDRVEAMLPAWEPGDLAARLDEWCNACQTRFRTDARIRWRRAHAHALLDSASWRVALNDGVSLPPRVRRVMGDRLRPARRDLHMEVQRLLQRAVASRLDDWRDAAAVLSAYTPGALLGAADDVAGRP